MHILVKIAALLTVYSFHWLLGLEQDTVYPLALLILLVGIIALVVYYGRRKKASDHKFTEQQHLLDRTMRYNEVLLKEIHHRVKNNLQVVSSLLSLQERSLAHDGAVAAIRDGRSRVQSLALVHKNLYQSESQDSVEVGSYVRELCQNIIKNYDGSKTQSIELKTFIEPLLLDIDAVVSLGLIINELILNALKFAFNSDGEGEIKVTLKRKERFLILEVSDNGIEISEENQRLENELGFKLIRVFLGKLRGSFQMNQENGNHAICRFDLSTWKLPVPTAPVSDSI